MMKKITDKMNGGLGLFLNVAIMVQIVLAIAYLNSGVQFNGFFWLMVLWVIIVAAFGGKSSGSENVTANS